MEDYNFVCISEIDIHSSVYTFKKNQIVEKDNKIKVKVQDLEKGDKFTFTYNNKNKTLVAKVKFFSKYEPTCFTGNCRIKVNSNTYKTVDELQVGDMIETPNGFDKIKCILQTEVDNIINIYVHNGLEITGYHPVKDNNKWEFPINLEKFKKINKSVEYVYSIGLEKEKSFIIGENEIIGLGHNISDNSILKHDYFGTDKVINEIFKISPSGYATINMLTIRRDKNTNLVVSII